MSDAIHLRDLELPCHIGVPPRERAAEQVLRADITLEVPAPFETMGDEITATIDYHAAALRFRAIAAQHPRRLIETLAADLARCALDEFGAAAVTIEVRKQILPFTRHVAVSLHRRRDCARPPHRSSARD